MKSWLILGLWLAAAPAAAATSGIYEQVLLAAGPDGGLRGQFVNINGQSATEKCQIFFAAPAAGPATVWSPGVAPSTGALAVTGDNVTLTVPTYRAFPGCGMAGDPTLATGEEFSLTRATGWIALDQVSARRAYLHAAPADRKMPRAYVVKGDVLGLLGTANGWLHVEYIPPLDTAKSIKGWIAPGEAAPLAPR
jgi:hypothetical protein